MKTTHNLETNLSAAGLTQPLHFPILKKVGPAHASPQPDARR